MAARCRREPRSMDQIIDWVYSQIVGFLGDFFAQMGNMGVELFEMS